MEATTRRISLRTPERVRTRADVFPIWYELVLVVSKAKK
jgi:hypothetical protein